MLSRATWAAGGAGEASCGDATIVAASTYALAPVCVTVPSYVTVTLLRSSAQFSVIVVAVAVSPAQCLFSESETPEFAGDTWIVTGDENVSVAIEAPLASFGVT